MSRPAIFYCSPSLPMLPGCPGCCFCPPANLQISLLFDTKNTETLRALSSSVTFLWAGTGGYCCRTGTEQLPQSWMQRDAAGRNRFILCPSLLDLYSLNGILAKEASFLTIFLSKNKGQMMALCTAPLWKEFVSFHLVL